MAKGAAGSKGTRPTALHQGAYYQHLVRVLGATNGPLEPRITVPPAARDEAHRILAATGYETGRPLVVFAPGAAYGTAKRWWPSHFAQLATDVIRQHGAQVVLAGSAADAATTDEIVRLVTADVRGAVLNLAGRTSLEALAAIMTLARVCVSNDSGAMHLAAAAGAPLAAIFGPTNERETAPLTHAPLDLLIHDVPCRPCMLRECPIDHPCMRDLAPARVLGSVTRLLMTPEQAP
jgi:heptosyltransferase-2